MSEKAAESLKRKTLTHKGGYLKYWNNDWKRKRAGSYDGVKECRRIVSTGNKIKSKARNIGGGCKLFYNGADGRKNGIKIVGERSWLKVSGGEEGVRQTNGHEAGGKRVHPKYSKCVCSTG